MRLIRAAELVKHLGISRRTVSGWCATDPSLAVKRGRQWWIKVDVLAKRQGYDIITARTLATARLIKAVDLATIAQCSRRTIASWCRTRTHFAKRIGRIWYVDLDELGATPEQIKTLETWAPEATTAISVLKTSCLLGQLGQKASEEVSDES